MHAPNTVGQVLRLGLSHCEPSLCSPPPHALPRIALLAARGAPASGAPRANEPCMHLACMHFIPKPTCTHYMHAFARFCLARFCLVCCCALCAALCLRLCPQPVLPGAQTGASLVRIARQEGARCCVFVCACLVCGFVLARVKCMRAFAPACIACTAHDKR